MGSVSSFPQETHTLSMIPVAWPRENSEIFVNE